KEKGCKDRLEELRRELAELKEKAHGMRAQWEAEKAAIEKVRALREQIEQVRRQVEEDERQYDLNRAAQLKHRQLTQLEAQLREQEARIDRGGNQLLREEVTEDEIAEIVSKWTGIPVTRLMEGERETLLRLDEILHQRVVGQEEAVQLVADAVIRARSGIKDPRRPIGSPLLLVATRTPPTALH